MWRPSEVVQVAAVLFAEHEGRASGEDGLPCICRLAFRQVGSPNERMLADLRYLTWVTRDVQQLREAGCLLFVAQAGYQKGVEG